MGISDSPIAQNSSVVSTLRARVAAISSLQSWYDASDPAGTGVLPSDNSALTTWVDLVSGTANNLSQSTGGNKPTFRSDNNNYRIVFNGTSSYMNFGSDITLTTGAIACVFAPTVAVTTSTIGYTLLGTQAVTNPRGAISIGSNSSSFANETLILFTLGPTPNRQQASTGDINTNFHQFYLDSNSLWRRDGVTTATQKKDNGWDSSNAAGPFNRLGTTSTPAEFLNASIKELLFFNAALSLTNLANLEAYLQAKWSLPVV